MVVWADLGGYLVVNVISIPLIVNKQILVSK